MKLVTVIAFDNITRLGLVRSYLESEGIECFVKDEFMGTIYSAVGVNELRMKIQVKETDVDEAIRLLIEGGFARSEDYQIDETMLRLSKYYQKFADLFKRKK